MQEYFLADPLRQDEFGVSELALWRYGQRRTGIFHQLGAIGIRGAKRPFRVRRAYAEGAGSRATAEDLKPGQLSPPVLNILNPTSLPDPAGLGAVLGALTNLNFRDMSGLAGTQGLVKTGETATLDAATAAGKLASDNMKTEAQKAVSMGQIAADIAKSAIAAGAAGPAGAAGAGAGMGGISRDGAMLNQGRKMDSEAAAGGSDSSGGVNGSGGSDGSGDSSGSPGDDSSGAPENSGGDMMMAGGDQAKPSNQAKVFNKAVFGTLGAAGIDAADRVLASADKVGSGGTGTVQARGAGSQRKSAPTKIAFDFFLGSPRLLAIPERLKDKANAVETRGYMTFSITTNTEKDQLRKHDDGWLDVDSNLPQSREFYFSTSESKSLIIGVKLICIKGTNIDPNAPTSKRFTHFSFEQKFLPQKGLSGIAAINTYIAPFISYKKVVVPANSTFEAELGSIPIEDVLYQIDGQTTTDPATGNPVNKSFDILFYAPSIYLDVSLLKDS